MYKLTFKQIMTSNFVFCENLSAHTNLKNVGISGEQRVLA